MKWNVSLTRKNNDPTRPGSRFIHVDQNPFLAEFLFSSLLLVVYKFEHLSISNMARAQLLRWLRRDAERVPQSPPKNQAPPTIAAIRPEVYLAPHIFTAPYSSSD